MLLNLEVAGFTNNHTSRLLKNYCGRPSAASRGASSHAYPFDMSRSMRSVLLASGRPRGVFQQLASAQFAATQSARLARAVPKRH
jgi:hypothetical protein